MGTQEKLHESHKEEQEEHHEDISRLMLLSNWVYPQHSAKQSLLERYPIIKCPKLIC
jgi:hypothetical protein